MSNIERTLVLIERLVVGPPVSQAELARELTFARSTLSDLLGELRALGYVTMTDRRYAPGARLLSLVTRASRHVALEGVKATLQALAERLGETAIFVIPVPDAERGMQVMSVEEAQSPHELRFVAKIGHLYPALNTTAGRAMLAFGRDHNGLPPAERVRIRKRGYALLMNDARGATLIAAPVRLHAAEAPVGAITIIGPAHRMQALATRIWPTLRDAVAKFARPESDRSEEHS